MKGEADFIEGQVKKVGKPKGKDKNVCWVKVDDKEVETVVDFSKDIETWEYKKSKVYFGLD